MNLDVWRRRVWAEFRACNLTRGERDVLIHLSHYGERPWPSHATLAQRARCSVRTVQRALAAGAALGLVQWAARRVQRGYVHYLEREWRRWLGANEIEPKMPARHFVKF